MDLAYTPPSVMTEKMATVQKNISEAAAAEGKSVDQFIKDLSPAKKEETPWLLYAGGAILLFMLLKK